MIYLNYSIVLFNRGYKDFAIELFDKAEVIYDDLDEDEREPELIEQR